MRVWAKGLLGLEAAVELLIGHGTWLTRADFAAAALTSGRDGITGAVMVSVDFEAALAARRAGGLPCSSGEEQVLALAASIAAGVPVALGDLVCGLDEDNAVRVAIAVLHAAGFGGRSVLVTRGAGGDRQRARRVTGGRRGTGDGTGGPAGASAARAGPAGLGRLRLRGVAMVVLVLPDGSKKRIPAAWAYEGGSDAAGGTAAPVVAAAADLLRLLRVVSGVRATAGNHAEQAARQSPGKEDDRAACTTQSAAGPGSGATIPAGQPAALAHRARRGRDRGTPDHPGGATRIAGRARNASPGAGGPAQQG